MSKKYKSLTETEKLPGLGVYTLMLAGKLIFEYSFDDFVLGPRFDTNEDENGEYGYEYMGKLKVSGANYHIISFIKSKLFAESKPSTMLSWNSGREVDDDRVRGWFNGSTEIYFVCEKFHIRTAPMKVGTKRPAATRKKPAPATKRRKTTTKK